MPKTVALVGMSKLSRHLAPWDDPNVEIWCLNRSWRDPSEEAPFVQRWDRWFEIHSLATILKEDPDNTKTRHVDWLKRDHGDRPIYMAEQFPWFPNARRYPIESMIARYGNYFTSTMAYMFALAITEGFEVIKGYGFEMTPNNAEYAYQIPNFEYFRGLATGLGIKVELPEGTYIGKQPLYAYEDMLNMYRTGLGNRDIVLNRSLAAYKEVAMKHLGAYKVLQELLDADPKLKKNPTVQEMLHEHEMEYRKAETQMNMVVSAREELAIMKDILAVVPSWSFEEDMIKQEVADGREATPTPEVDPGN